MTLARKDRINRLLNQLQAGIYEKENEMAMALLAALAGESLLLLGPPGVAKSMVARRLKYAFAQAHSFEYLMSRFSTPDELFGPVSITRLKESDTYERTTEGFLPTADVVFLDEIWKAGPAIQNTLLTVMNEKLFRNGNREEHLPLKLLVAASNELPAKGEGLEALWDRFLVRLVCRNIQDENIFRQMLCQPETPLASTETAASNGIQPPIDFPIQPNEYALWQQEANRLPLSPVLLDAITLIRQALQKVTLTGSDLARRIYISDRRWKHLARLLRTSAYMQDRQTADTEDLLPMYHCLWNEPEEIPAVQHIVWKAIAAPVLQALDRLAQAVKADLRACQANKALQKALREGDHRDDDLHIADGFFYQIENHGTGHTYVFITDFKRMPVRRIAELRQAPAQGIIYTDPSRPHRRIVRMFSPDWPQALQQEGVEQVTLCRDDTHIYINGVAFKMRRIGSAARNPATGALAETLPGNDTPSAAKPVSSTNYEAEAEAICTRLDELVLRIKGNAFAAPADLAFADSQLPAIYKQIALTRADIRKLLYNE
ncbi:MAG: AAA family ATPase [Alloprevotella sp.]